MTIKGLRQAMLGALELHKNYPANKAELAGKQSKPVDVRVPEELPDLKGKYGAKLDYEGKVVQSCIHCHQIRDSERMKFRESNEPMPAQVLYPYPLPELIGLRMNPDEAATVAEVAKDSPAAKAGIEVGDRIVSLDHQPLLSTADLQWVLHHAPASGELSVILARGKAGEKSERGISLPDGWRGRSDISWRPTTWQLRGIATGGLVLEDLSDGVRRARGISNDALALKVKYVGQYGHHAAGKNAGFEKDDVIIEVGDVKDRRTESEFFAYALKHRKGEELTAVVRRSGKTLTLRLPIQ
jgi:membrane-associated protease RseP (regulator of RpoE activity)